MTRLVACGLMLALLAVACGGSNDDAAEASRLAVTQNADVAALLGTPLTESDVEAEGKAIYERIEELTAQCMAAAGFEYLPIPFDIGRAQQVPQTDTSLGQTDLFFAAFRADFEPPADRDPNESVLSSMSEDERLAFQQSLQGDGALFDPRYDTLESIQEAVRDQAQTGTGCRQTSQQRALAETDRNQPLIDEYQLLRSGMVNTDQRIIRARVEWATCMAEAGFIYRDEAAIFTDLSGAAANLMLDLQNEGVVLRPFEDPPAEVLARIDELRDREREVAGAHAECREITDNAIAAILADADALFLERYS